MRVRLFGSVRVESDTGSVEIGRRPRLVLARLAVSHGQLVSDDALVDAIWGDDPPPSARTALQGYVSTLRDVLSPGRARGATDGAIVRDGGGYRLTTDQVSLDLADLEQTAESLASLDEEAIDAVLAMTDDRFLSEWSGAAWALDAERRVATGRRSLLVRRAELELEISNGTALLTRLAAAHADDPFDERLAGLLMTALYRTGRQREALEVYERVRTRLLDEVGATPGDSLRELHLRILQQTEPTGAPTVTAGSLSESQMPVAEPSPDVVGRSAAIERLTDLVVTQRHVTLTGPGGVGKSAVAAAVVADVARKFDRVEAFDAADGSVMSVAHQLTERLGLAASAERPVSDLVRDHVGDAPTLVVVDTCEAAGRELADLVRDLLATDSLTVFTIGREPLGLSTEHRFRLEGLTDDDAVRLVRTRIPDESEVDDAALRSIARRLDGVPLALLMVAPSIETLGADTVLRQLDLGEIGWSSSMTTEPRHRSAQDLVGWSLDRVDDDAVELLIALSIVSGWLDAAAIADLRRMAGGETVDGEAVAPLAQLVDASLVRRRGDAPAQFRAYDLVRSAVRTRWPERVAVAERRVADGIAGVAWNDYRGAGPALRGHWASGELATAAASLLPRADVATSMFAIGAGRFWLDRGAMAQGREILEAATRSPELAGPLHSLCFTLLGFTQTYQGDLIGARASYAAAAEHADSVPSPGFVELIGSMRAWLDCDFATSWELARRGGELLDRTSRRTPANLVAFSKSATFAGDFRGAIELNEEAIAVARALDVVVAEADARRQGALAWMLLGDHDTAWSWIRQSVALHDASDTTMGSAQAAGSMALVSWACDDLDSARTWIKVAIERSRRQLDIQTVSIGLPVAAALAVDDDPVYAAVLDGWLSELIGTQRHVDHPAAAAPLAMVRSRLERHGAAARRRWRAEGAALTTSELLAVAAGSARPDRWRDTDARARPPASPEGSAAD